LILFAVLELYIATQKQKLRCCVIFNPVIQDIPERNHDYPDSMLPVIFKSNGEKLIGSILIAQGAELKPAVIFLHGFPGNENNFDVAHSLRRAGFNVLIFHYTGSWGSGGKFSFKNSLQDVVSAVKFLKTEFAKDNYRVDSKKIALIGHSMGGFLSLITASKNSEILCVASLAGFNFGLAAKYVYKNPELKSMLLEGLENGTDLLNGTTPDDLFSEMIENRNEWDLCEIGKELSNKKVLLIGAKYDGVSQVEIHHAPLIQSYSAAGVDVEHHILEGGHSFPERRIKLAEIIVNWISNHREIKR